MGEDWAASSPFPYFSNVGGDLPDTIRAARREQLADWPELGEAEAMLDPVSRKTFLAAKLDWAEREGQAHAEMAAFYRGLIALRQAEIVPRLDGTKGFAGSYQVIAERLLDVSWTLGDGTRLQMLANLHWRRLRGWSCGAGGIYGWRGWRAGTRWKGGA